jgi:acyl carrier protein
MELGADAHEQTDLRGINAGGLGTSGKVREILSQHGRLSGPVDQLSDTSDLYAAGLTSLATVGLMLALEEGFDIEFPDSMLSRKTFASIASLVAAVETLRAS